MAISSWYSGLVLPSTPSKVGLPLLGFFVGRSLENKACLLLEQRKTLPEGSVSRQISHVFTLVLSKYIMKFLSSKVSFYIGTIMVAVAFLLPSVSSAYNALIQYAGGNYFYLESSTAYVATTDSYRYLGNGFSGTLSSTTALALIYENNHGGTDLLNWELKKCDNSNYTSCTTVQSYPSIVRPVYVSGGVLIGTTTNSGVKTLDPTKYYYIDNTGGQYSDDNLYGASDLVYFVLTSGSSETSGVINSSTLAFGLSPFSTSTLPSYIGSFDLSTCNPFQGEFDASTCVANLFLPNGMQWAVIKENFEDSFLTRKPFGYVTRFIAIIEDTSSSSPPTIDITFPSSIFPTQMAGASISFSPFEAFESGSILSTATSTDSGDTILESFMPVWRIIVYLGLIMAIVHDLIGHSSHRKHDVSVKEQKS